MKILASSENIYLAFLRVKNKDENNRMFYEEDVKRFERNIDANIEKIKKTLESGQLNLERFDVLYRFKSKLIDGDEEQSGNIRPMARYSFIDEVKIQAVFNVIGELMRNSMPEDNYGAVISAGDSVQFLEPYFKHYKRFVKRKEKNTSPESKYEYCYIFDLKNFYGVVSQKDLKTDFKNSGFIKGHEDETNLIEYFNEIIEHYSYDNINKGSELIHRNKNILEGTYENSEMGLPQSFLHSQILSIWYIRDFVPILKNKLAEKKNVHASAFDIFMYVDDGVIFSEKELKEVDIKEYIKDTLSEIQSNNELLINEDKSFLIRLDEDNTSGRIKIMENDVSILTRSLFHTDYDPETSEIIKEKIDNVLNGMILEMSSLKNESIDKIGNNNDVKNIQKTYENRYKRSRSKITQQLSTPYKYLEFTTSLLNESESNAENINLFLVNFNYVMKNLLLYAPDKQSIRSFIDDILNYFKDESEKKFTIYNEKMKVTQDYYLFILFNLILDANPTDIFESDLEAVEWIEKWLSIEVCKDELRNKIAKLSNEKWKYILSFYAKETLISSSMIVDKCNDKQISISTKENVYKYDIHSFRPQYTYFQDILDSNDSCYLLDYLKNYNLEFIERYKLFVKLCYFWKEEYYSVNEEKHELNHQSKSSIDPSFLDIDNLFLKNDEIENENTVSVYFKIIDDKYKYKLNSNISKNVYREIMQKTFSEIFKKELNTYFEETPFWLFRIQQYLKERTISGLEDVNGSFNMDYFFKIIEDVDSNFDMYSDFVGGNIEKALSLFNDILSQQRVYIDKLLVIHYMYHNMWKNGSKDLTFFTLHNESHALKLIENYKYFKPKISHLLKSSNNIYIDFLLLSACYLHDIGMLVGPSNEEITDLNVEIVRELYDKYIGSEKLVKYSEIGSKWTTLYHALLDINKDVNDVYEEVVRRNHAVKSYSKILTSNYLPLSEMEKKVVAVVSKGHGEYPRDVMGRPQYIRVPYIHYMKNSYESYESTINIDIRKMKMILRLLDLSDVGSDRVTRGVFDLYYERMSELTRAHWIKHLSVDNLKLNLIFEDNEDDLSMHTKLEFVIERNYLGETEKSIINKNKGSCFKYSPTKDYREYMRDMESGKQNCNSCNLTCRFINLDYYFEAEIDTFNRYFTDSLNTKITLKHVKSDTYFREDFKLNRRNITSDEITATESLLQYFK